MERVTLNKAVKKANEWKQVEQQLNKRADNKKENQLEKNSKSIEGRG